MRFETQTNLYDQQPLITKLTSHDTRFDVVQGEINALISESEMTELVNGGSTMYSAMNDIKIDVTGLHADLSSLETTVDGNIGNITELTGKQAEYEATLDNFSASLSDTRATLYGDGTTQGVVNRMTAVEADAAGLSISVSNVTTNLQTNYYDKTAVDGIASGISSSASSALTNAVSGLQTQIDGKIETWCHDGAPTTTNYPASSWNTSALKDQHIGDLYYDTKNGYAYQYAKSGNTYVWNTVTTSGIGDALTLAGNKRRVFVAQPTPPYEIGDLWVQGSSGDIMRCSTARASGSYTSSDWVKASKYTDDSTLNTWLTDTYASDKSSLTNGISDLQTQVDGKIETWTGSDPSTAWTTSAERTKHTGDLWYDTNSSDAGYQKYFRYTGSGWVEITANPPSAVVTTINSKGKIFTAVPTNADSYSVGDLWVNAVYPANTGATYNNEILKCKTAKASGTAFNISHWEKASKYTDDSALATFMSGQYAQDITAIGAQIDNKVEVHYGTEIPTLNNAPASSWSASERDEHVDDLYYNTSTGYCYRFVASGSTYTWNRIKDSDITSAATAASTAQSIANGKATIFTGSTTPALPRAGDLWLKSANDDILTYVNGQWLKYNKYTDDSYLNNWLTETYEPDIDGLEDDISALQTQVDGKIETWYQSDDPSLDWTTETLRTSHIGDLFYYTGTTTATLKHNSTYRWDGTEWVEQDATVPDEVFDAIDGKAQIFTSATHPNPPYNVGDLWFSSASSDIMTCVTAKSENQSYATSDWAKRNKYTDDTTANSIATNLANNYSTTTQIQQNANGIISTAISNVDGSNFISQINQTAESISINADKINLQGYTTVNGNFSIDSYGRLIIQSVEQATTLDNHAILAIHPSNDQATGIDIYNNGETYVPYICLRPGTGRWPRSNFTPFSDEVNYTDINNTYGVLFESRHPTKRNIDWYDNSGDYVEARIDRMSNSPYWGNMYADTDWDSNMSIQISDAFNSYATGDYATEDYNYNIGSGVRISINSKGTDLNTIGCFAIMGKNRNGPLFTVIDMPKTMPSGQEDFYSSFNLVNLFGNLNMGTHEVKNCYKYSGKWLSLYQNYTDSTPEMRNTYMSTSIRNAALEIINGPRLARCLIAPYGIYFQRRATTSDSWVTQQSLTMYEKSKDNPD